MTLTAPSGPPSTSADPPRLPAARRREQTRQVRGPSPERELLLWLYLLIVVVTVFQRFVLPGTVISVSLPAAFLVTGVLVLRGLVVADLRRTAWYSAAVAACFVATFLATTLWGLTVSLSSLLLLAVLYIPCCTRVQESLRGCFPAVLDFFQRLMVPLAAVCIGQWVAQMVGWEFTDLLSFVPANLMFTVAEYNLSYPLYYGSSIYKSNGIVFNEPSFASQFLALAIIVQILRGGGRWRIALFGAALLTTMAGTGLILLAVGIAAIAVQRGGRWAARAGAVLAVTLALVSVTPVGELLGDRGGETAQSGSSGHIRFVAPYEQVWTALSADVPATAVGRGAGSVSRDGEFFNPYGVEVNYPVVPKLVGEYGLPAALLFIGFLLVVLMVGAASRTLGLLAVTIHFVLSGALLQPQTVYLCWIITGLFAASGGAVVRRAAREVGRRPVARSAPAAEPGPLPRTVRIPSPAAPPRPAPMPADTPVPQPQPPSAFSNPPSSTPRPRPRPRPRVSVDAETVVVEPAHAAVEAAAPVPALDADTVIVPSVRATGASPAEPAEPGAREPEATEPNTMGPEATVEAATVITRPEPAEPEPPAEAATVVIEPEPAEPEPPAPAEAATVVVERERPSTARTGQPVGSADAATVIVEPARTTASEVCPAEAARTAPGSDPVADAAVPAQPSAAASASSNDVETGDGGPAPGQPHVAAQERGPAS